MFVQTKHRFNVREYYASKTVLGAGETATPAAFADAGVDVSGLLAINDPSPGAR